ncbi:MAG TPA: hypothetical protein DHN33_06015 [Eubacteriaceae bacterium]|nr:hypothetical protein [Eubacteriaceae bacterium]
MAFIVLSVLLYVGIRIFIFYHHKEKIRTLPDLRRTMESCNAKEGVVLFHEGRCECKEKVHLLICSEKIVLVSKEDSYVIPKENIISVKNKQAEVRRLRSDQGRNGGCIRWHLEGIAFLPNWLKRALSKQKAYLVIAYSNSAGKSRTITLYHSEIPQSVMDHLRFFDDKAKEPRIA